MVQGPGQDRTRPRTVRALAPRDRGTAWLCAVLVGVAAVFAICAARANLLGPDAYPAADFFGLWSYARLVLVHPAAWLYDPAWLHGAQLAMGMRPGDEMPFPYPPTFLLLVWPIGLLAFGPAYVAWIGGSLCLCLAATCLGARGTAARVATTLLAPSSVICMVAGQGGFLLAALLVGGLRLLDRRPLLAGVLFGLLTYKPQFGLLLPVALVAGGRWRAIAAACATTAALLALDTAVFGPSIWAAWWRSLPGYAAVFDAATAGNLTIPTVLGNAQALGLSHGAAQGVQAAAALLAAAAVWAAWRRPGPFAAPVLLAATCLATPHAFLYDLPMLSAGAILFAAERLRAGGSIPAREVAALAAVLAMPAVVVMLGSAVPVSSLATGAFLWVSLAAGRQGRPGALPLDPAKASPLDGFASVRPVQGRLAPGGSGQSPALRSGPASA